MKLLEVVAGQSTSPDTVATGFELARRLGKTPVSRRLRRLHRQPHPAVHRQAADLMMQDGASPYEIDAAVRAFGYPMGPYQMADLAGGDIGWATRKRRAATRDPALRYVRIPDLLCERGWFGQKSGRGFYLYPDGARQGEPDPEVLALIDEERRRRRLAPAFSQDEIQRRYLAAMINEAAKCCARASRCAPRISTWCSFTATAFPGSAAAPCTTPTAWAWNACWPMRAYAAEDPAFWKPSPLLAELAASGRGFASLNR